MAWRAYASRNVAELRLICCPSSASSAAARNFYESNYKTFKMLNPRMPFLIRSGEKVEPYVVARYDWNAKEKVDLAGLDEAGIGKVFEQLTKKGATMPRSPESLTPFKLPIVVD